MTPTVVRVSTAADSRLLLRVLSVDLELRLYQDDGDAPVFDARKVRASVQHPLQRPSRYYLRYNNNDGGLGVLHFQLCEERTEHLVRHEVNRTAITGPEVIELEFAFLADPALSPPV